MTPARRRIPPLAVLAAAALTIAPVVAQPRAAEAPAAVERAPGPPVAEVLSSAGYLGVSVRSLNPELRRYFGAPSEHGVLVASLESGSPAERAGLAVGDVIVAVDGRPVDSPAALYREIRGRAGAEVELEIYRDGAARRIATVLDRREQPHADAGDRHRHRARHHDWDTDDWNHDDWVDHWVEWGEEWADWGAEWGEWGAEFGERWGELGARIGERWAERGAEWGAEWGALGARIGMRFAEAFAGRNWDEMDWDEVDRAIDDSMRALDEIDWDEIGDEIERAFEEIDAALEDSAERP